MNTMEEALAALDGKIEVAPSKIPEGATVIGIELSRDPARSGRFVTAIDGQHWVATGMAVAIRNGHAIAANYVFGRVSQGVPKVTACHYVTCQKCGERVLMPLAVWQAKDTARKAGIDIPREAAGMSVLREHGRHTCGGSWYIDDEAEKADLAAFTAKVLDAVGRTEGPMPAFVAPTAFSVGALTGAPKPIPGWEWLTEAMAKSGKAVRPFDPAARADTILFNPGFWVGHISDPHTTGLFWVENGARRAPKAPKFNPAEIDGL